jgi:hypothetical protein
MRRRNQGQLALQWEAGLGTRGVPEKAESKCRELLVQLLREVVRGEREREVSQDEREDHAGSS